MIEQIAKSNARHLAGREDRRVARIRGLCNKCVNRCVFWESRVDPIGHAHPRVQTMRRRIVLPLPVMSKARKLEVVAVVLAVLCAAGFLLSIPYAFGFGIRHNSLGCASGCLVLDRLGPSLS